MRFENDPLPSGWRQRLSQADRVIAIKRGRLITKKIQTVNPAVGEEANQPLHPGGRESVSAGAVGSEDQADAEESKIVAELNEEGTVVDL